jgi:hypothetical protein
VPALLLRPSISALAALLIPGLLLGCGSDSSTAAEEPQATAIVVTAADFLNGAQCIAAQGALRRWGANLKHTAHPAPVPGAPPIDTPLVDLGSDLVDCVQGVAFGEVEVGGTYQATICGYNDPELRTDPELDAEPELKEDVCSLDGGPAPDWIYTCGDVVAEYQALRHVRNCKLESAPPDTTKTEVTVALDPASAGLECGEGADQLERFQVFRDGEPLSEEPVACSDSLTTNATANDSFDLELLAYRSGEEEPAFGTVCHARAVAAATVAATCDPLRSEGGIEVSLAAAMAALGADCTAGSRDLLLTLDTGEMIDVPDATCTGAVRFSGVTPGERELTLTATRASESLSATCSVAVQPGLVAAPACDSE